MRQRFSWSFGILQSLWKHRAAFGRKGVLGWIALTNIAIFQVLLPVGLASHRHHVLRRSAVVFRAKYFHPESTDPASFQRLFVSRRFFW